MHIKHGVRDLRLVQDEVVVVDTTPLVEAVIFDLDGVITDTAEYHYQAWKELADALHIPFDRGFNEKLKGIGRMESLQMILDQGNAAYSEAERLELANKKNERYVQLLQQVTRQDLLPGIQKLLDSCKQQGIKIGLASASKNAGYVVARLGIEGYFDTIVDAAKVAKGKPDPEIFMTAAEQLKVPCAHCVGIEDAEAGIEAIQAAGMFAVGVGEAHAMRKADFRVGDTSELTLERIIHKFKSHQ